LTSTTGVSLCAQPGEDSAPGPEPRRRTQTRTQLRCLDARQSIAASGEAGRAESRGYCGCAASLGDVLSSGGQGPPAGGSPRRGRCAVRPGAPRARQRGQDRRSRPRCRADADHGRGRTARARRCRTRRRSSRPGAAITRKVCGVPAGTDIVVPAGRRPRSAKRKRSAPSSTCQELRRRSSDPRAARSCPGSGCRPGRAPA
jgi:hypothetical protein